VVFFGVTFSMLLTLFVVPTVYKLVAKNTKSPEYVARLIDKLAAAATPAQKTAARPEA
jgi:HAE1 family hydrophobic/amphiphilic exporter-1